MLLIKVFDIFYRIVDSSSLCFLLRYIHLLGCSARFCGGMVMFLCVLMSCLHVFIDKVVFILRGFKVY